MNIFSNVGITELIFILLLALLVVGPERLPELARQLGKLLRDVRTAYENLTRDLGPELTSIQETSRELRESVQSVRSIPQDAVKSALKAAELDETVEDLKGVTKSIEQAGQTLSGVQKTVRDPVRSAVDAARNSLKSQPVEEPSETTSENGPSGPILSKKTQTIRDPMHAAVAEGESDLETSAADEPTAEAGQDEEPAPPPAQDVQEDKTHG
jgi:sec-independent protein translocase protein TatB